MAAYQRHKRRGEPACALCTAAKRRFAAARREGHSNAEALKIADAPIVGAGPVVDEAAPIVLSPVLTEAEELLRHVYGDPLIDGLLEAALEAVEAEVPLPV